MRIYIAPSTTPMSLEDLLPFSFGPADLGKDQRLLSSQHHSLILDAAHSPAESALDRLTELALEFANASYSPYTQCPSGVAIRLKSGVEVGGSYAENAAFNPSISPLKAAMVAATVAGGSLAEMSEVVLVELALPAVSHEPALRAFCSALLPACSLRVFHATERTAQPA